MRRLGGHHERVRKASRCEEDPSLANRVVLAIDVSEDLAVEHVDELIGDRMYVQRSGLTLDHSVLEHGQASAGLLRGHLHREDAAAGKPELLPLTFLQKYGYRCAHRDLLPATIRFTVLIIWDDGVHEQYSTIMNMSIPYERTGRTHQKARTRMALLEATRELLTEGVTPTVEQAADRAMISRTTAYRYFPNQRTMLAATYPEITVTSMLGENPPSDPAERLEVFTEHFTRMVLDHEPELRTQLRLALDPSAADGEALPLRQGRGIAWIEDALAPLRELMSAPVLRRLVLSIRATLGIEALIWLTDIAGISREEAVDIMRSSARTLLRAAMEEAGAR